MRAEIEAKFLDINPQGLRAQLHKLGAALVQSETLMRRKNFDYPDKLLEKRGGWVRVRDEGTHITLSYKQLNERTLHGTGEVSVVVDDFERTCEFLADIGLVQNSFQETLREVWQLGGTEVAIDTWPWIPTFVELEGASEKAVKTAAMHLGLPWEHARHGSVEVAYQYYYDVTDQEIDGWKQITFRPVPDWLEAKRKHP